MNRHFSLAAALSLALWPVCTLRAADDPPADPSLARDRAKAVSDTVKHDAKVVADAAKEGCRFSFMMALFSLHGGTNRSA
jgi:hypothetical protein